VIDIKGDTRKAFDWTQESMALTGDKKVDAYIGLVSSSALAVSDALKRNNAGDRLVVGWDVDPDTLEAIKAGVIDSTVAQKPYTMGYCGLKSLDAIYHNPPASLARNYSSNAFAPYPAFVDTGTSLVDKSNAGLYIDDAAAQAK